MNNEPKIADCWLQIGQLDPSDLLASRYLHNEKYKVIRTKHKVTEKEAIAWCEREGRRRAFQIEMEDPSLYVSYFWTLVNNNFKGITE